MKSLKNGFLCAAAVFCALPGRAAAEMPRFTAYSIGDVGNSMGQTSLVNVDRDGDLDWVVGQKGKMWWFEYVAADNWIQHDMGSGARTDVGGCAFDIDGDGWVDQVSSTAWYRNTGKPRTEVFERFANGAISCHDNMAADIDGDGRPDVVRGDVWFENADGKGTQWKEHPSLTPQGGSRPDRFGLALKSWVCDLDGDGDNDILQAEADTVDGRVFWFENLGQGKEWRYRPISPEHTRQDFHSLAVADFDNDGDLDVFSGGGPLSKSVHQCFVWENLDCKGGQWKQHMVLEGKRCHEAKAADVDGDGDIDICFKPWRGSLHVYLRNMLVEDGGR